MTSILLILQCSGVFGFGAAVDDERGRRLLQSAQMHRELLDTGTVLLTTTTSMGGGTHRSTYRCDFDGPKFRVAYFTGPRANPAAYGGDAPDSGQPWVLDLWDGGRLITRQFAAKHEGEDVWKYLIDDNANKNVTNFFCPRTLGLLPYHGLNCADLQKSLGLNGTVTGSRTIEGTPRVEVNVEFPHPTYGTTCFIKLIVDGDKDDNITHYEYKVTPSHGRWEGYQGDVELQRIGSRWYPKKVVHHSLVANGLETMTMTIEVTDARFGVSFPKNYFTLAGLGYHEGNFLVEMGVLPNP